MFPYKEGTKLVTGFGTTSNFIAGYLQVIRENDLPKITIWLFESSKKMSEAMFFDPSNDWQEFAPEDILALRVCAPKGVFTSTAKSGYLTRVGGNQELTELANALFSDDFGFINGLPESCKELQSQLKALMFIVYDKKIRPIDSRIKLG